MTDDRITEPTNDFKTKAKKTLFFMLPWFALVTFIGYQSLLLYLDKGSQMFKENIEYYNITVTPTTGSLRDLCKATKWQPNLYLNCTNVVHQEDWPEGSFAPSGLNNIRNIMVTCLRWAIDAGIGFIMPRIAIRSKSNPEILLYDKYANYSYLLDEEQLRQTINNECPELKIYDTYIDVPHQIMINDSTFKRYRYNTYRAHTQELLSKHSLEQNSTVFWENDNLLGWWLSEESVDLHRSLLNAVQWNPHIREIGKRLIKLINGKYIAFHLRQEDVLKDYPYFISWFVREVQRSFPAVHNIVVACGDLNLIERFRTDVKPLQMNVISKWDLAAENQTLIDEINSLNFDQVGIIDYELMLPATHFYGFGGSSFSYSVSIDRGNGDMRNCGCTMDDRWSEGFINCF